LLIIDLFIIINYDLVSIRSLAFRSHFAQAVERCNLLPVAASATGVDEMVGVPSREY